MLGAVVLPVTATCVATVQLTRGIINTPESIREDHRGKFWDEQTRCWVVYNPAEQIALEGGAASADAAGSSGAAVADGGTASTLLMHSSNFISSSFPPFDT